MPARTSSTSSPTARSRSRRRSRSTEAANDSAQAFVDYEYTDEAQQLWADNGYRPVVHSVLKRNADKFPTPADLFTIDDLGGWDQVTTDFFDPQAGSIAEIEQNLGVATE